MTSGMTNILSSMRSAWPVSDESVEKLCGYFTPCSFPRRYRLIEADRRCPLAYFVERGLTRSYWMVNGEEITTSFSHEGGIVFSMDELYYDLPSQEYVETIERIDAFSISLRDLRELFATDRDIANWGRVIHQNEYRRLHQSHKERLTLPARERYEAFRQQFPDVCRRANLSYIASYLGITPSTLSRLRKSVF